MWPLAHNNIDLGLLTAPQNAEGDLGTDAVGAQMPEDLPGARHVFTVPTDDAVAQDEAGCGTWSVLVEMNDDGTGALLSVPQWMQLNAEVTAGDRAGLCQPVSDPFNGQRGNYYRSAPWPKCSQADQPSGRIDDGAAVRTAVYPEAQSNFSVNLSAKRALPFASRFGNEARSYQFRCRPASDGDCKVSRLNFS